MTTFLSWNVAMSLSALTALSPVDGRYGSRSDALRPVFSEFGLIHARVRVEIEWLIALAMEPEIRELPAFSTAAVNRLRAMVDGFNESQAQRIKDIERTTNHDVKAVEYLLKEKVAGHTELAAVSEFI